LALAGAAALATAVLQPVAVASGAPAPRSPADVATEADGCPTAANLPVDGDVVHCSGWSVSFVQQQQPSGDGCVTKLYMLVPLSKDLNSWGQYVALWTPPPENHQKGPWVFTSGTGGPYTPPEGWSTTEITPQTTTLPTYYTVPKGYGAWFVGLGGGSSGGCSPAPTGSAVAYVMTVQQHVHSLSGQVTVSGSTQPAPGITVSADCGGGATTDSNGDYSFLVNKGRCTVAPQLGAGEVAVPAQRVVDVGDSDVTGVDFQVPCSAVSTGPGGAGGDRQRQAGARFPAAISSAACLQVFIKIVGPIPNVGTRSGLSVDNYVHDDGPVNFTRLAGAAAKATPLVEAASTGQQCVSGCANILITVVNKATHKPAANAHVNVELGAIDTDGFPNLHQQGTQFLCVQTDKPEQDCGTSLDSLPLDGNGQVRLLYWAPGELVPAHVELYAQACTASACLLKRAESKITVYPYRIYHYDGELSPETVVALVRMVECHGCFDIASHAAEQGLEATAEAWMELLEVQSHAVELALGPLGFAVAFTILDLAHARSELLEEAGLRGAFFDATGLAEAGLYGDSATSAFAKALSPGDAVYMDDQVLDVGTTLTLPRGWLWQLGEQLAEKYPGQFDTVAGVKPEPLDLSVYETSYCSQYVKPAFHSLGKEAQCGPGYGSASSPNIHTDLCIFISQLVNPTCGIPYDAPVWVVGQEAVDKKLHHPDALDTSLP
jgi:hypothetical protein